MLLTEVLYVLCVRTLYLYSHTNNGCSESNASYFILLAHNVRGRCWWGGNRGWTFPPIFLYVLLPCDRWQQRGSLSQQCLTWKCRWSKGVSLNASMQKKRHPLTFIMFAECLWTSNSGCEHSEVVGGAFQHGDSGVKDKPHSRHSCTAITPWNEEHTDQRVHENCLMMVTMLKNSVL